MSTRGKKSWYSNLPTTEETQAADLEKVQRKYSRTYLFKNHMGNPPCLVCLLKLKHGEKISSTKAWIRACDNNHYFLVSINDKGCKVIEQLSSGDVRLNNYFAKTGRKRV